ncbi:MAG: LPS export ABC transporter permease LptF [Deltaproteobacteria bacterium]|nr:LPS export ABC transporter permease LptF [Deltaproteobacteria bacterium]
MKRKRLSRYLISEILPPFLFGIVTFTCMLMVFRILKLIDLVVTRGVPLSQVGKLLSLIVPTFLELTVPMAFLLAILLGLGRLAGDQEIIALKASGVSPWQILKPIACLAAVVALITLGLTLFARPAANQALRRELFSIAKVRLGTALKEKVFNDDFPKILLYIEELVPPGNTAKGVMIIDKRERNKDDIILGKVAFISTDEETNSLGFRVFDGSVYSREKSKPGFSQTKFNIYDFKLDLDELVSPAKRKDAGPKETSLARLLNTIRSKESQGIKVIAEKMELHQRLSFAFVPLVFCLLGVALTLLPRSSRASRSWAFTLCLFWLMAYYALLSLGKALGDKGTLPPWVALWLPNMVVGTIAAQLFFKAIKESPLKMQTWFDWALNWGARRRIAFRKRAQA